ncbi:MAG TPA: hypothetical protein VIK68_07520 [Sphingomicrobium sp.]
MKYRALLSAAAIVSTSFAPFSVVTTPAFAVPVPAADQNPPDEQQVCDDLYVNNQTDPSVWRATVTNASEQATDPAPVEGSEQNVNFRPDTTSTFSYAGFTGTQNPLYRIGGSPNMWGQMVFNDKVWDNTLYDVQMDFNHTVSYAWTCHVEQFVTTTVHVGGGNDNSNGNNNGKNEQDGGNGNGNNGCGNGNGGPNGSNDNCGGHDVTHSEWDLFGDFPQTAGPNLVDDGFDITQTGLQLAGHVSGVTYDVFGTYMPYGFILLSCISPGKKGGTWTPKSYYSGGSCNTTTFNSAPTILGHEFDSPPTASVPSN